MPNITINQKSFVKVLIIILFVLTTLNIGLWIMDYLTPYPFIQKTVYLFDFDSEANIPTLYSTLLILTNAAILLFIGYSNKIVQMKNYRQWFMWAYLFAYVGIDESAQIHEKMMDLMKNYIQTSGYLYFSWIIPGTILVMIFVLLNIKFLRSLPTTTLKYFLVSGCIYLVGAIGVEAIGGFYVSTFNGQSFSYRMITTAEEFLEMLGLIIFIYGLLNHLSERFKGFTIRFKS